MGGGTAEKVPWGGPAWADSLAVRPPLMPPRCPVQYTQRGRALLQRLLPDEDPALLAAALSEASPYPILER